MKASLVKVQAIWTDVAVYSEVINRRGISESDIGEAVEAAMFRLKEKLKDEVAKGLDLEDIESGTTVLVSFSFDT